VFLIVAKKCHAFSGIEIGEIVKVCTTKTKATAFVKQLENKLNCPNLFSVFEKQIYENK
jgi:hypothetical protein